MSHHGAFVLMAAATVLSPGPGIVMTLTNSLRHGLRGAVGGILGIATGALAVAGLSATGLGLLLATSELAFHAMKFAGAACLAWLGIRLWRAPALRLAEAPLPEARFGQRFFEGLTLQLMNPKALFFFLSVFPQFIEADSAYAAQFTALVLTYSGLVVAIHCLYAAFAGRARAWLTSARGGRAMNRAAGTTFLFFAAALAATQR